MRVSLASDLMSQHLCLLLGLVETFEAIRLQAVIFTLLRLEQGNHLIDDRDDL